MSEQEIWKSIPGSITYDASNHGRIRSWGSRGGKIRKKPYILKQCVGTTGYMKISIYISRKRKTAHVHSCVLKAFYRDFTDNMECCHTDGNKLNNNISNLRWDTKKNNQYDRIKHGTSSRGENNGSSKLKRSEVLHIRDLSKRGFKGIEIFKMYEFRISHSNIRNILCGTIWKHI